MQGLDKIKKNIFGFSSSSNKSKLLTQAVNSLLQLFQNRYVHKPIFVKDFNSHFNINFVCFFVVDICC